MSTRRGIISLIPKKDRDHLLIKNWHPLTLLNTDFKILAKLLANKFKPCLENLIHPCQTGFIAGWSISNNTRKILDIVNYAEEEKIEALVFRFRKGI